MFPHQWLSLFATFLYISSLQPRPAWGALPYPDSYVHLSFNADRIQDQYPNSSRSVVEISNTQFRLTVDFYFVPGEKNLPAYGRAHFNVRRGNHTWQKVDTGFHSMNFADFATYQITTEALTLVGKALRSSDGEDFRGTPMPRDSMIASTIELPSEAETLFGKPISMMSADELKSLARPILSMDLAVPNADFAKPRDEIPIQMRLSYESFDFAVRSQSILYRKMLYGPGSVMPLTGTDLALLEYIQTLAKFDCEAGLTNIGGGGGMNLMN